MSELRRTYLVQRLKKPYKGNDTNPFNFGGGLLRGGMNEDAYRILNQIFTFDYMGAAEFEFGVVPKAIEAIAQGFAKENGVCGETTIDGVSVYYLTHKLSEKETVIRINELAHNKIRLKEWSAFNDAISIRNGKKSDPRDIKFTENFIGWLELDNNFAFFVDKEAYEKFKKLVTS